MLHSSLSCLFCTGCPSNFPICSGRYSCLSTCTKCRPVCSSAVHGIPACLQLCTRCMHVRFVCLQSTAFLLVSSSAHGVCMSDLSVRSARHSCLSAALHKVSACQICLSRVHGIPACLQLCTRCLHVKFVCPKCTAFLLVFSYAQGVCLACHCGNTRVERTPNKSQQTKLTLEKNILSLLPGLEPATFRSRVRRSCQQAILAGNPIKALIDIPGTIERQTDFDVSTDSVLCLIGI